MTIGNYLKDKMYPLLLNAFCAAALSLFLRVTGTGRDEIILILLCWVMIAGGYFVLEYQKLKKKFARMDTLMESLDKKYLFPEIVGKPDTFMEHKYFSLQKRAMKSMTDHVAGVQRTQTEYKQFIEQWIHEVKRPIAAAKLICENNKNEYTRKLLTQIEEIDYYAERALYYARLGHVEKDYFIKETILHDVVMEVLARNKQVLIQNNVRVDTIDLQYSVFSDKKWLVFILNQIITNSIQYKSRNPHIIIKASKNKNRVALSITDNGIGIKESELRRIFQLGFTGSNGRNANRATGIGLYLCKELCQELGIAIDARSASGSYTEITLSFSIQEEIAMKR